MSRHRGPSKASAASRTMDMFQTVQPQEAVPEVIQAEERGERVPLEEDSDRCRENAFKGQEWTTKYFGKPEAPGNEYRMSFRGEHYYLETLSKLPGGKTVYGYSGLMLHERDLFAVANLIVLAARGKKERDAKRAV